MFKSLELDLSEEELKNIINDFDKNGDGQLGFIEFLDLMASVSSEPSEGEKESDFYRLQFNLVDTDGSGMVSINELDNLLKTVGLHLTETQLKNYISQYDTSGTGELSFNDFCEILKHNNKNDK